MTGQVIHVLEDTLQDGSMQFFTVWCALRLLLAMGSVDNSIWLLLRHKEGQFQQVCRLKGHSDWIRSLAFTTTEGGAVQYQPKYTNQFQLIRYSRSYGYGYGWHLSA